MTVASFSGPSYTQTTLATFPTPTENAPLQAPAAVSPDGTHLLMTPAQGAPDVALYPIAGGAPTTVSATGEQAAFTANGDVIFIRSDGTLQRYTPAPSDRGCGHQGRGHQGREQQGRGISGRGNQGRRHQGRGDRGRSRAPHPRRTQRRARGSAESLRRRQLAPGLHRHSDDGPLSHERGDCVGVDPGPHHVGVVPGHGHRGRLHHGLEVRGVCGPGRRLQHLRARGVTRVRRRSDHHPVDRGRAPFTAAAKLIISVNGNALTGSADLKAVDLPNPMAASTLVTQADPNYFYRGRILQAGALHVALRGDPRVRSLDGPRALVAACRVAGWPRRTRRARIISTSRATR